jgi:hypothetical protein
MVGRTSRERIKYGAGRINWDFTPSPLGNVKSAGATLLGGLALFTASGNVEASDLPTIRSGTNTSFGPIKQIDSGLLNVGYAESGPANGPAVWHDALPFERDVPQRPTSGNCFGHRRDDGCAQDREFSPWLRLVLVSFG